MKKLKIAFIGTNLKSISFAIYLKKKGLDVYFVYDEDLQLAVEAAVKINCKASSNLKDIIDKSDVIMIASKDEHTRYFIKEIKKLKPKDKMICMLNECETSDIINMNNYNSYFSIYPLNKVLKKEIINYDDVTFIIEGRGNKYWEFIDELDEANIKIKIIKDYQKKAYMLANQFITEFSNSIFSVAADILENAGILDTSFIKDVALDNANYFFETPKDIEYFDNAIENGEIAKIDKHFEALDSFGNNAIKSIYKILAISILTNSNIKQSEKDRIKKIILSKK